MTLLVGLEDEVIVKFQPFLKAFISWHLCICSIYLVIGNTFRDFLDSGLD